MSFSLPQFFRQSSRVAVTLAMLSCTLAMAASAPVPQVFIEDMTWVELHDRVLHGASTVLIPIGGTEQSGPHMALGKHNVRVKYLVGQIAERLGNAVVAPVLAYVPEGNITPPSAHMRFTGTMSIAPDTFEAILTSTAKAFKQHGFRNVVYLGDHGGYQKNEVHVADKLNKEWAKDDRCRVHALTAYYEAAQAPFSAALRAKGLSDAEIGTHAGVADTSLLMAVDPSMVRSHALAQPASSRLVNGVYGDPTKSSAELGQMGIKIIIDKSVQAIREATR
ncbi:MAG TPA: creatininase family protein [Rhodoferax sp.]